MDNDAPIKHWRTVTGDGVSLHLKHGNKQSTWNLGTNAFRPTVELARERITELNNDIARKEAQRALLQAYVDGRTQASPEAMR